MQERVDQLGGALDLGPTAEGWRVRASLPLPTGNRLRLGPPEA
jgi:signal transduction histidine kinase